MRDVIQKVIAAETEAKHMVEEARTKADRIVSDSHQQARDLITSADQAARVEARRLIDTAIKEAEQLKQQKLTQAITEIEAQVRLDDAVKANIVKAAIRCICVPPVPAQEKSP